MHARRLARDEEPLGDLAVAQSLSDKPQHLHFTRGEPGRPAGLQIPRLFGDSARAGALRGVALFLRFDRRTAWIGRRATEIDPRTDRQSLDATKQRFRSEPARGSMGTHQGLRRFAPGTPRAQFGLRRAVPDVRGEVRLGQ